jgi:uncharacterized damage-inducible protein DinB
MGGGSVERELKRMTSIVDSVRAEYLRYKALAEKAIAQLSDDDLTAPAADGDNSIPMICWHISGNLQSRFTDFLTSDGEKPWRHREEEFQPRTVTRAELLAKWKRGWDALLNALTGLSDADLERTVTIRSQPLQVSEALHRSLAHVAYHVGQIVYIAKSRRGSNWTSLSIPRGQSDAYNQGANMETASAHTEKLAGR